MGKPDQVTLGNLATKLGYKDRHSISEHLNLVDVSTPKEVNPDRLYYSKKIFFYQNPTI